MGRRGLLMRMLGMSETREPGAGTGEPRSNVIVLILVLILVVRVWEEAQVATILLVGVPICPETGDDVGIEEFLDIRDTGEDSDAGAEKTARSGDGVGRAEVGIVVMLKQAGTSSTVSGCRLRRVCGKSSDMSNTT
jgi:hypothetical protein